MTSFRKKKIKEFFALCESGSLSEIKEALRTGIADINMTDEEGCNALMHAANANNDPAVITFLINEGIDADARDNYDRAAIHYAAMGNNNPQVMKSLIDAGADDMAINPRREELREDDYYYKYYYERGTTALMLAAKYNTPEVVKVLIKAGADLNISDIDVYIHDDQICVDTTYTPLEYAARYNTLTVVQTLINFGAKITDNALSCALEANTEDVIQFLASCVNDDIDHRMDSFLRCIIHNENSLEISHLVSILPNSDINAKDPWGNTLLLRLISNHVDWSYTPRVISILLEAGIDVNAQNDYGHTALILASQYGHIEIINILLDHGANADIRDNDGKCALDYAKNKLDIDFTDDRETLKRLISATKITVAPILSLKIALMDKQH